MVQNMLVLLLLVHRATITATAAGTAETTDVAKKHEKM